MCDIKHAAADANIRIGIKKRLFTLSIIIVVNACQNILIIQVGDLVGNKPLNKCCSRTEHERQIYKVEK